MPSIKGTRGKRVSDRPESAPEGPLSNSSPYPEEQLREAPAATHKKKSTRFFSGLLARSLIAVIAVALALLIRVAVAPYGKLPPFHTFYAFVLMAAMLGGIWAGFLTTALSALAAAYWLIPPVGVAITSASETICLTIFCTTGIFVSVTAELYNRKRDGLAAANAQLRAEITERKQVEEELRLSEEKFAKALAISQAAMGITRLKDGVFLDVNDTWVELVGYSREEMIGHSSRRMIWPTRDATARCLRKLREKGWLRGYEQEFLKKSGEVFVAELWAQIWILNGKRLVITTLVDITARKRAEKELRDSEARLEAFFENSPNVIFLKDRTGRYLYVNKEFRRALRINREQIKGKRDEEIFPAEQAAMFRANDRQVLEAGVPMEFEEVALQEDGPHTSIVQKFPLFDARGEIYAIGGVAQDITERKRTEEALRLSEERLRVLGDNLPSSVVFQYTRDPNGTQRFLYISAGVERLNGVKVEDVLKDASVFFRQVVPHHLPGIVETENISARELSVFEREVQMRLPDGQLRWMRVLACPRRLPDGRVVWDGVQSDITERKQAEEALRRNEARLRLALDAANSGIWEWDPRTNKSKWSADVWRLYGLDPGNSEPSYESWVSTVHPEDREMAQQKIREAINSSTELNFEYRVIDDSGDVRWLALCGRPLLDESVDVSYIGIVTDISSRKRAEEALLRSEKLAAAGRMAATIAHEVNNPLAGAVNAVYAASTIPEQAPRMLALADQELRRAAHIVQQTLGFYREHGSGTPIAIRKSIDEVLTIYAKKLQDRNISVECLYRCGPCTGDCDGCLVINPGELRQIISNLVANGLDALADNGVMRIRVSRVLHPKSREPEIQLTIADNGCGIRTENLKRIFEPFFTTKKDFGTGLGLWATQELVRKHNGNIRVRSSAGKGTIFRITFPVPTSDPKQGSAAA